MVPVQQQIVEPKVVHNGESEQMKRDPFAVNAVEDDVMPEDEPMEKSEVPRYTQEQKRARLEDNQVGETERTEDQKTGDQIADADDAEAVAFQPGEEEVPRRGARVGAPTRNQ